MKAIGTLMLASRQHSFIAFARDVGRSHCASGIEQRRADREFEARGRPATRRGALPTGAPPAP
jgi:hypothetical protein